MADHQEPPTAPKFEPPHPGVMWEYNFVQQMKRLREAKNMTQTDLARVLKIHGLPFHQQTIQRIETGERPVRLNEANLIAKELGVDLTTMSDTVEASDREIRYAVDRVRNSADNRAEEISGTLVEWIEDVEAFAVALSDRLPHGEGTLDPVSRWALLWAIKVNSAHSSMVDAWENLQAVAGGGPRVHAEDEWESVRPMDDVIDAIRMWIENFTDQKMHEEALQPARVLYAEYPGEKEGGPIRDFSHPDHKNRRP